MTPKLLTALALITSVALGTGAGILVLQVAAPEADQHDVKSITGVSSGVDGSGTKEEEKKGVETIPPTPTPATDPSPPPPAADPNTTQSQTVDIEGVEGTEGGETDPPNTVEIITTNDGVMQSIRGIQGIDTVMLQNLEAVLRMQAPPPPPEEGGGGGRAAAALLTMEADAPPDPEEEIDEREELTEFEFEGS